MQCSATPKTDAIWHNKTVIHAVQCNMITEHTMWHNATKIHAMQCNTTQIHGVKSNTTQMHEIWPYAIQYYTTQI